MKVELIGYVRMSRNGKALKVDLIVRNLNYNTAYQGKDGTWYIGGLINLGKLTDLLEGRRGVITLNQVQNRVRS
jgi:hypothetical protein